MKLRCLTLRAWLALFGLLFTGAAAEVAAAQASDQELAQHQQRAQQAEMQKDFEGAIREYRSLLKSVPNSPELQSNLGVALYFHHEFTQAAQAFRRASALKPGLYTPHLFLGLTLADLGQPNAAVIELKRAESIRADDPLVHTWLGYEYTALSEFGKAAEQLQIVTHLKADDEDVWFALGRCYLEMGKSVTEELLRATPASGRTLQLAAEQYEAQGNTGKALQLYILAYQKRSDLPELRDKITTMGGAPASSSLVQDGIHVAEDRLYDAVHADEAKAREAFEQVSRLAPDSYRAHQVLGDSAAAAGHFDEAIREYRIVLDKNPDLPGIHGDLCNALSRTAHIEEAIQECGAELVLSPYSASAYIQAARVRLLADDEAHAEPLLRRALALERPPMSAYKLLGKIDLAQKRYPTAIQELSKYLIVEPKDASAWFLLARACKGAGDTTRMNQAIAAYKRYGAMAQQSGDVKRALGTDAQEDASDESGQKGLNPL